MSYRIGEVARHLGTNEHTLRYYEKIDLVVPERDVVQTFEVLWITSYRFFGKISDFAFLQIQPGSLLYSERRGKSYDPHTRISSLGVIRSAKKIYEVGERGFI